MKLSRTWALVLLSLTLVWSGVAAVMWLSRDSVSSPDEVLEMMAQIPKLDKARRSERVDPIVAKQNLLDLDQRRSMREDGEETLKAFFESLSEPDQHRYVDGTAGQHLKKVVKILDSMKPEDRRQITARLRRETGRVPAPPQGERASERGVRRSGAGESRAPGGADPATDRESRTPPTDTASAPSSRQADTEGMEEFLGFSLELQYHDSTPAKKLEMAQMLENMQGFLQGLRR